MKLSKLFLAVAFVCVSQASFGSDLFGVILRGIAESRAEKTNERVTNQATNTVEQGRQQGQQEDAAYWEKRRQEDEAYAKAYQDKLKQYKQEEEARDAEKREADRLAQEQRRLEDGAKERAGATVGAEKMSDQEREFLLEMQAFDARQEKRAKAEEAERAAIIEEKRIEQENHVAGLRSGKIKPTTTEDLNIVYGAAFGYPLASAPKIKPDGKLYTLRGIITDGDDSNEFMAELPSYNGEHNYFIVRLTKKHRAHYLENAKVNGSFVVVGKYVANKRYTTVAGEGKGAPVFEAVYFLLTM